MSNEHAHESSVATYVIVALVLGIITYIEFALVEFEIAWLSSFWILFWLVLLSVAKFILVIMFFMHLKDDDNVYSGFFGSGMIFALGTFAVLALLFTLPASFRFFQAQSAAPEVAGEAAPAEDDEHGETALSEDVLALIETDGYSRPVARLLNTPRPKSLQVTLRGPALAEEASYTLTEAPALFGEAAAHDAPAEEEAAQQDDDADQAAAQEEAPEDELAAAQEEAPEDEQAAAQEEAPEDEQAAAQEDAEPAEDEAAATWDQEIGEQVYASNCSSCHQAQGTGIPGAFPPLAEHMPVLYNAEGGRSYVIDVLLYGLQGQIDVRGQSYNGVMPAWQQLSDDQIAAVLNHTLTSWGNQAMLEDFSPITAQDVADQRGQGLTGQQVHEQREALALP